VLSVLRVLGISGLDLSDARCRVGPQEVGVQECGGLPYARFRRSCGREWPCAVTNTCSCNSTDSASYAPCQISTVALAIRVRCRCRLDPEKLDLAATFKLGFKLRRHNKERRLVEHRLKL
jgi:hypothetical protein